MSAQESPSFFPVGHRNGTRHEVDSDRGPVSAGLRRVGLAGLTASVGAAIIALCASAPASADTVLMVGGADVQAFPGAENGVYMPAILGGSLCKSGSGNQCLVVPFSGAAGVLTPNNPQPLDAAVATATDQLAQQIMQTPGKKIAVRPEHPCGSSGRASEYGSERTGARGTLVDHGGQSDPTY